MASLCLSYIMCAAINVNKPGMALLGVAFWVGCGQKRQETPRPCARVDPGQPPDMEGWGSNLAGHGRLV